MNISSFFSVKDFLIYYIAGVLWFLELATFVVPINCYQEFLGFLEELHNITDKMGILFSGVLLFVLPYIFGFVLTPVSEFFTKQIKEIYGDPKKWITDYSETGSRYKGQRLAKTKIRLIVKKLREKIGNEKTLNKENIHNWFFLIRDFVISSPGEAASHAIRAHDLSNFTENITLPLPLIFTTLGVRLFYLGSMTEGVILGIFGCFLLFLLSWRYLRLRKYWVKHVYSTFLVISRNNPSLQK